MLAPVNSTADSPGMSAKLNTLTAEQVEFYNEHGWLRIPAVFTQAETDELADHLDWAIETWASKDAGWSGPCARNTWTPPPRKNRSSSALHDLQLYSDAWMCAVTHRKLCGAMADLLGPVVALHHSTLHVKPPETGHPFPMHQDWAFYKHNDDRYIDCLVHLDNTRHENGEIRFLDGSHKLGILEHITKDDEGRDCTPHLPTDKYRLQDTVPVPARAGDVVIFNILTIHGSHINTTDRNRRLVRVGYKHPENAQTEGQSKNRPTWIVWGHRRRLDGMLAYATE